MELISSYSRRKLKKEEVYTFSLILCDNEIDRDYECFSKEALQKIADLFVGKTGIFDHNPKANHQTARIFKAEVLEDKEKKTSYGENYFYVKAKAYMLRTETNRDLILEIDGGIKKEVSVGLSVKKKVCSVCQKRYGACSHQKGEKYGDKICFAYLKEPEDAYEWSFVAVPAQRNAGVTKAFLSKEEKDLKSELKEKFNKKIESEILSDIKKTVDLIEALDCGESVTLTKEEARILRDNIENLGEAAMDGFEYKESLEKDIIRLSFLAGDNFSAKTLHSILSKLTLRELKELKCSYEKRLNKEPFSPQLVKEQKGAGNSKNNDFKI